MPNGDYDPTGAKYRTPEPKKDKTGGVIILAVIIFFAGAGIIGWLVVNGG